MKIKTFLNLPLTLHPLNFIKLGRNNIYREVLYRSHLLRLSPLPHNFQFDLHHPGLSVSILINNRPLTEYPEPDPSSSRTSSPSQSTNPITTSTTYIASTPNTPFAIRYSLAPPFSALTNTAPLLGVNVFVDGTLVVRETVRKADGERERDRERRFVIRGVKGVDGRGKQVLRSLRFVGRRTCELFLLLFGGRGKGREREANMKLIADENVPAEGDQRLLANAGRIDVEFWRLGEGVVRDWYARSEVLEVGMGARAVHEKALKGEPVYHCVDFVEEKVVERPVVRRRVGKLDQAPIACFTFKYRSEQALKELMIIERTPEPELELELGVSTLNLDGLTPEQRSMAKAYVDGLKSSRIGAGIKREHVEESEEEEGPLKKQKRARKGKEKMVVIDLCDD
ncbi:uncharacterized protein LY89DRAFT_724406 [Mollisia scopiformis]|uniref:DUF7918 domain-containing protein n=1 Tax=Mollisia scopiformis TaxID=149040 RepID=A0A132BAG9_MOLSC|nr:uncharacterized protein LY89DRAFT_724406 [Mollisia scopiformis]KUJ09410.1 hypothetical protein LY89DRAFT_724406 [Mollisia scopiformis]